MLEYDTALGNGDEHENDIGVDNCIRSLIYKQAGVQKVETDKNAGLRQTPCWLDKMGRYIKTSSNKNGTHFIVQ